MNRGPIPWLPAPIASLASRLYLRELRRRNRNYDKGVGVTKLDLPIISIGNLSVGGTGKTPLVEHIARILTAAGARPAIAMRGYRASNGLSDEAREYELAIPDILTLVSPDRIGSIRAAQRFLASQSAPPLTCILLDDGFQHRRLARDLDIVLIDATRSPFDDNPLPRGWLREPVDSLRRAHAAVITRADLAPEAASDIAKRVASIAPNLTIAAASYQWTMLDISTGERHSQEPVDWLREKRLLACSAIGNPDAFLQQVTAHAASAPVHTISLRDHDKYAPGTINSLIAAAEESRADAIITTRKDWTKLSRIYPARFPCPVARPVLGVHWHSGGDALENLLLRAIAPLASTPA